MKKDHNAAALLIEDLKNGLIKERNEAIKEEIYAQYGRHGAGFDEKKSRFELADVKNAFVQNILQTYDITYEEYLRIYCEVRNDGFFYPDEIEDIDALIDEKLAQEKI